MEYSERTELDIALSETRDVYMLFSPTLSVAKASTMAVWDAHTHCTHESEDVLIFSQTPRLAVLGLRGSGKTTMLKLTKHLARQGQIFGARTATPAGMINSIREAHCTLLMDEVDKLVSRTGNAGASPFEILNTGYDSSGQTLNAVGFQSTFAPVALAGKPATFMGNPNLDTLRERSIRIFMERLPRSFAEEEDGYDEYYHEDMVKAVGERLSSAVQHALDEIQEVRPNMRGLTLRTRQIWRPLYQVAAVAGGDWGDVIGSACRELSLGNGSGKNAVSPAQQLRTDIAKVIFETKDNLTLEEIVRKLTSMGSEAIEMYTSLNQATRAVSQAVSGLGLNAHSIWFNGAAGHGYKRDELETAFKVVLAKLAEDLKEAQAVQEETNSPIA